MNSNRFSDSFDGDRTGYDPKTETYHEHHDWDGDRTLTTTVAEAVTEVTADDPTTVEPLYETVDPDALETYLHSFRDAGGVARFTFNGHAVTVWSDGEVCVHCEPVDDLHA